MNDLDPTERLSDATLKRLETSGGDAPAHALPHEIGSYRVVQRLEGGMGIVYVAEQSEPIARRVAIKVMKYGLDSREMLARFDAERRVLALLNHPNIAQIYEAGATASGQPYFVMEYVDGLPITDYCATRELPMEDRLALFQQVCLGVQQAHQKGVIHRDLKPSNILVTEVSGRPVPKIIDFGIAKMIDASLNPGDARTRAGDMLGTPEYASPEQLSMSSLDIDTRSDVYSLGVVLYELSTGLLPFDLDRERMSLVDILRVVRDEDPLPPSARAGKGASELDWITMRALEKDPSRRYQSPAALAADLQRYLDKEPVEAGPPSRVYRFRKLVRRHVAAFLVAAAVLVTLVVTGTIFGIGLKRERDEAMRQAARAEAMNRFLFGLFDAADPYAAGFGDVESDASGKLIRRGVARLDVELANQPELRTEMLARLGEVMLNLNLSEDGEKTLRRAVADRARLSGTNAAETLHVRTMFGRALFMRSSYEEADHVLSEALAALRANGEASPADLAEAARSLGRVKRVRGDFKSAKALYDEALAIRRSTVGENDIDYASTLGDLAALEKEMGHLDQSVALQRKAIAIFVRALGENHPEVSVNLNNLAASLLETRPAEAEMLLRKALSIKKRLFPEDHVELGSLYGNLARALSEQEKFPEARALAERSVAIARRGFGEHHSRTARARTVLGKVCVKEQDFRCAEEALRPALAISRKSIGADSVRTAEVELVLGAMLLRTDRRDEARLLLTHAAKILEAAHEPSHRSVAESRALLAELNASPR